MTRHKNQVVSDDPGVNLSIVTRTLDEDDDLLDELGTLMERKGGDTDDGKAGQAHLPRLTIHCRAPTDGVHCHTLHRALDPSPPACEFAPSSI
ncbi:MAG: hypothetical protein VCF24_08660, partial [Candidatus Latescibacterota bacterium]